MLVVGSVPLLPRAKRHRPLSLEIEDTRLLCDFWPHGKVAQMYGFFRGFNRFSKRANIIVDEHQNVIFIKVYPVRSVPDISEIISFLKNYS